MIKNQRLRNIIEHRADNVLDTYDESCLDQQELQRLIGQAVQWRNRFTHGRKNKTNKMYGVNDREIIIFLQKPWNSSMVLRNSCVVDGIRTHKDCSVGYIRLEIIFIHIRVMFKRH